MKLTNVQIRQMIKASRSRGGGIVSEIDFRNPFIGELYRQTKSGRYKKVAEAGGFNDVTVVGKNHMLDVTFGNSSPVTQVDPWYIGLINQSPTPTLSENDTLASHAGWSETTDYAGNRKAWDDANAASKIKGATSVSTFVMNATLTVHGIFVCAVATGTSGVLWATGSFDVALPVISTDELRITYGIRT